MAETRIVFDEDGFPCELIGRAEWERAIADGRLTPDTRVTVYGRAGGPQSVRAGDAPELREMFTPAAPPPAKPAEPEPVPAPRAPRRGRKKAEPPEQAATPVPSGWEIGMDPAAAPAFNSEEDATDDGQDSFATSYTSSSYSSSSEPAPWWGWAILLLLVLAGWMVLRGSGSNSENAIEAAADTTDSAAINSDTAVLPDDASVSAARAVQEARTSSNEMDTVVSSNEMDTVDESEPESQADVPDAVSAMGNSMSTLPSDPSTSPVTETRAARCSVRVPGQPAASENCPFLVFSSTEFQVDLARAGYAVRVLEEGDGGYHAWVSGAGGWTDLGPVYRSGACWNGTDVRVCAWRR